MIMLNAFTKFNYYYLNKSNKEKQSEQIKPILVVEVNNNLIHDRIYRSAKASRSIFLVPKHLEN